MLGAGLTPILNTVSGSGDKANKVWRGKQSLCISLLENHLDPYVVQLYLEPLF